MAENLAAQSDQSSNGGRRRHRGRRKAATSGADGTHTLHAEAAPFVPRSVVAPTASSLLAPSSVASSVQTSDQSRSASATRTSADGKPKPRRRNGRGRGRNAPHGTGDRTLSRTARQPIPEGVLAAKVKEAGTIRERLQESLARNEYECNICLDVIRHNQNVWEDRNCWAIFHLKCIKQWAEHNLEAANAAGKKTWRCPACQQPNEQAPADYTCFCEKELHPEHSRLAPHSCGQTCARSRRCTHPCTLQCHPGPCPPCTNMGPELTCWCGKESAAKRCIDTDYELHGWSCAQVCGEVMPCDKDEHTCQRPCHPGLCGACTVEESWSCYCGDETKTILCSERGEIKQSFDNRGEQIEGCWQGGHLCGEAFDCGEHTCEKACHARDNIEAAVCPRSPALVTACSCGKTAMAELLFTARERCTDDIPKCDKSCGKELPCGHACDRICCDGQCPSCQVEVERPCACGSSIVKSSCQDALLGLQPSCEKLCKTQMSCRRHICQNQCCSGLPLARERKAREPRSRKQRQLGHRERNEEIESEHICTRTCGRLLTCGQHSCGIVCHEGPCPACLVASFDDLTCHCGRTKIVAPVRCGTKPPACTMQCRRPKACGHPQIAHHCHGDEVDCPRCVYLTEQTCACGKKDLRTVPCWQKRVSCGMTCGEQLACGRHSCRKVCHTIEEGHESPCQQICGLARACGHGCAEVCHAAASCPQDEQHPCQVRVQATCACGHLTQQIKCNSTSDNVNEQPKHELPCNDMCAAIERRRQLTEAFKVKEDHKPQEPTMYDDQIMDFYMRNKVWCQTIETQFRNFFLSDARSYAFKPMKGDLRNFIHKLADIWGCHATSLDEEPRRAVELLKWSSGPLPPPIRSLAQAAQARADATAEKRQRLIAGTITPSVEDDAARQKGRGYNTLVLVGVKFGTTKDELDAVLYDILRGPDAKLKMRLRWPDEIRAEILERQDKTASTGPDSETEAGAVQTTSVDDVASATANEGGTDEDDSVFIVPAANVAPVPEIVASDPTAARTLAAAIAATPSLDPQRVEVELARLRSKVSELVRRHDLAQGAALGWIDYRSLSVDAGARAGHILKYRDPLVTADGGDAGVSAGSYAGAAASSSTSGRAGAWLLQKPKTSVKNSFAALQLLDQ